MPAKPGPAWPLTPHWATAVVLGMAMLVVGLVLGRAELVVFAAPLLLTGAGALLAPRLPGARAAIDDDGGHRHSGRLRLPLELDARGRLAVLYIDDGVGPGCSVLITGTERIGGGVAVDAELPLSGRRELFSWQLATLSPDSCLGEVPRESRPVSVSVLPAVGKVGTGPLPKRLHGLTGSHASRTPGEGAEFRDIHELTPGDSLRRIDWRATARKGHEFGQPYVRRTFATAEAAITLVVDANDDLVPNTDAWLTRSPRKPTDIGSLHLLREGAAAVAAGYLSQGDRVGLTELVSYRRGLRAAPGHRQLDHIRTRLMLLRPAVKVQRPAHDLELVPGCVAIVFSTFMDADAARLMAIWQRLGHPVLGVDILPWLSVLPADPVQQLAVRMVLAERKASLTGLRDLGIPVLGWRGEVPGGTPILSLDSVEGQLPLAAGLELARTRLRGAAS